MAILDYLKYHHPADKDTYTMVALTFTMYRQIAEMLEERAHQQLREFKGRPFGMLVYIIVY